MKSAQCLESILSRRRDVVEQIERELTEIKPILPQVNLVAIMGGGYPSSEAMFPFGSEFNFDCGKVTHCPFISTIVRHLPIM